MRNVNFFWEREFKESFMEDILSKVDFPREIRHYLEENWEKHMNTMAMEHNRVN